ncbi:MAG: hypothetical protein AAGM22_07950 [Acidobacteriota bacterium]
MAALEANLGKLRRLRADQCCFLGVKVEDPNSYGRQYLGLVIDGRRMVYIIGIFGSSKPFNALRDYCDGGDGLFGVLYDPKTERFSDLAFNGFA